MDRERHIQIGQYLRDIIFAANDGIITTFAIVAGVVGADLSIAAILIIGLASLVADGFSMATGNYLGTKSEKELYEREEQIEKDEIKNIPEKERQEIREILQKKGYSGDKLEQIVRLISENEKYWVQFMMREELGLFLPGVKSPFKHGLVTFVSFIIAGSMPIWPYILLSNKASFLFSAIFSGLALFIIGALRKFFSNRSWLISGAEMLIIGGVAASIAYFIGFALRFMVS